LIMTAQ
jgi:hypothetical protein